MHIEPMTTEDIATLMICFGEITEKLSVPEQAVACVDAALDRGLVQPDKDGLITLSQTSVTKLKTRRWRPHPLVVYHTIMDCNVLPLKGSFQKSRKVLAALRTSEGLFLKDRVNMIQRSY